MIGTAIEKITVVIGIKPCEKCKQRKLKLNNAVEKVVAIIRKKHN